MASFWLVWPQPPTPVCCGEFIFVAKGATEQSWPASMSLPHHYFTRWAIVVCPRTQDTEHRTQNTGYWSQDPRHWQQKEQIYLFWSHFYCHQLSNDYKSLISNGLAFIPTTWRVVVCLLQAIYLPPPRTINWNLNRAGSLEWVFH